MIDRPGALELSGARMLVTGARGFVGQPLVAELTNRGASVRGHSRAQGSPVLEPGVGSREQVTGDLRDEAVLTRIVQDVDVVIHAAGVSHRRADPAEHYAVNRDATLQLAEKAADAGCSRFVFISSVTVCGVDHWPRPLREEDLPGTELSSYEESKVQAEEGLLTLASRGSMEVVVVRPPLVYGAGVKGNLRRLLRLLELPVPPPFGGATAPRSMVAVGNLVDFLIRASTHPAAAGRTYLVADNSPFTVAGLTRSLRVQLGRSPFLLPVPIWLLSRVARLLGRGSEVDRLYRPLLFDTSRARTELGWTPPHSPEADLRAMVEAYRAGHRNMAGAHHDR